jgi:hypothetical protein
MVRQNRGILPSFSADPGMVGQAARFCGPGFRGVAAVFRFSCRERAVDINEASDFVVTPVEKGV